MFNNIFKKKKQIETLNKGPFEVSKTFKYINPALKFGEKNDEFLEKITRALKDMFIFKTNIYCAHYGEMLNNQELCEKEDERFFQFNTLLRNNDYFKYYCILERDDINNYGIAHIAIEPAAVDELEKIASECNVNIEKIENLTSFFNFPYWGIQEPREQRILTSNY